MPLSVAGHILDFLLICELNGSYLKWRRSSCHRKIFNFDLGSQRKHHLLMILRKCWNILNSFKQKVFFFMIPELKQKFHCAKIADNAPEIATNPAHS